MRSNSQHDGTGGSIDDGDDDETPVLRPPCAPFGGFPTPSETPQSKRPSRMSAAPKSNSTPPDPPRQQPRRPLTEHPAATIGKGWGMAVGAVMGAVTVFVGGWEMHARQSAAADAAYRSLYEQMHALDVRTQSIELTITALQTNVDWVVRTLVRRPDTSTELNVQAHTTVPR